MKPRCPDTMVLVTMIDGEQGWQLCEKHVESTCNLIVFQCTLFEVAKVCARHYTIDIPLALYSDKGMKRILASYDKNSTIHRVVKGGDSVQIIDEIEKLLEDLPSKIAGIVRRFNMGIFPDPFDATNLVLGNPEENSSQIVEFVNEALVMPFSDTVKLKIEEYVKKYDIEQFIKKAKLGLPDELWRNMESDKNFLGTYLMARESSLSLQILTRDRAIRDAGRKCPDKFDVFCF